MYSVICSGPSNIWHALPFLKYFSADISAVAKVTGSISTHTEVTPGGEIGLLGRGGRCTT
jgi:hypothetical protein